MKYDAMRMFQKIKKNELEHSLHTVKDLSYSGKNKKIVPSASIVYINKPKQKFSYQLDGSTGMNSRAVSTQSIDRYNLKKQVIYNYGYLSKGGTDEKKQAKENQDNYLHISNFMNHKQITLIGVMDGHGINGAEVSYFIKKYIPEILESLFTKYGVQFQNYSVELDSVIQ